MIEWLRCVVEREVVIDVLKDYGGPKVGKRGGIGLAQVDLSSLRDGG